MVRSVEDWKWGSAWIRRYGTAKQKQLLSEGPTSLPRDYHSWVNTEDKEDVIDRVRTLVNKGTLFGSSDWVNAMVDTHKLGATLRGTGRPKESKNR